MDIVTSKTNRKRGEHSVKCLNPYPVYRRPVGWKSLPGELGKTFNRCRKRDISRAPYFVKLRHIAGRKRDFKPERRNLMNAMFELLLSRHDLATGIVEIDLDAMAHDLSQMVTIDPKSHNEVIQKRKVTTSRVCRFVNEVLIQFGLVYAERKAWDRANGMWFPKIITLSDEFYRLAGADLEKLYIQRDEQLQMRAEGLSNPMEVLSIVEARRRKREQIFKKSWEKRKSNLSVGKKRAKLHKLSLDERKHHIAQELVKTLSPDELSAMDAKSFSDLVWQRMYILDPSLIPPKAPSSIH